MKSYISTEENKKYLFFETEAEEDVDKVAMGMLENNQIPGLIPFNLNGFDDKVVVRFDITGFMTLSEVLSQCIRRNRVITILEQVMSVYLEAENYLIDPESILLDTDKIFYDKNEDKLYFIVTPVLGKNFGNPQLNVFLKNFICQIRFDSTENCDYIGKMLGYLNSDTTFSPEDFRYIVESQKEKKSDEGIRDIIIDSENKKSATTDKQDDDVQKVISGYTIIKPQEAEQKSENPVNISEEVIDTPDDDPEHSFKIPLDCYADDEDGDIRNKKSIFSSLFKTSKPKTKSRKKDDDEIEEDIPVSFCDKNGEISEISVIPQDETVYIGDSSHKNKPNKSSYLLRVKNNEKIYIRKNSFVIGSERRSVDYCVSDNAAVSRIHARIVKKDSVFFIVDNNSTNHTYINDRIIKCNSEMKLQNKSRVKLANEEFVFYNL